MATLAPEIVSNIAGRRLGIDTKKQRDLQTLGNTYNTNLANLGDYEKDAQQKINDQFAAQGIADSGIRVNEQGRLQKNVGQRRSLLGTQYAQGQAGIQSEYEQAIQALNEYQNEQMLGQTRTDLDTQLKQQQLAATQANTAAAQAAAAAASQPQAAPVQTGPSDADLAAFYAEVQRQQLEQFYAAVQANIEREYAGSGNRLGYSGARFR